MSWAASHGAIRLARHTGRPADHGRLLTERERVYRQIMENGWNPERQAFVQHYGSAVLDASLLLMPTVGFISPQDTMWLTTLQGRSATWL
jgi:GH15 family glucan-1,4-alpha-glucosidase